MITIEKLAEKLGKTVWSKGDVKRIYLNDAGWNTRKMSTKTFIFQNEKGEFCVSCRIECPSQPHQWIESQEKEVKDYIKNKIEDALKEFDPIESSESEDLEDIVELDEIHETQSEDEMVTINSDVVFATAKQISEGGLLPHIQPGDKEIFLWIYQDKFTEKGKSWMPVVEVFKRQNNTHTHKINEYYFTLPLNELHTDYCFENWIRKYCEITRLQNPAVGMKDIRGHEYR